MNGTHLSQTWAPSVPNRTNVPSCIGPILRVDMARGRPPGAALGSQCKRSPRLWCARGPGAAMARDREDQPDRAGGHRCLDVHRSRAASFDGEAKIEVRDPAVRSGVSFWTRAKCEAGVALGQWITGASIETIDEMEIRPGLVGSLHDHRGSIQDLDDHHRPKTPRGPPDRRS